MMNFNWNDLFLFSEALFKFDYNCIEDKAGREAILRACVSRSYYACYNLALDMAKRIGYRTIGYGKDHTGIQKYFGEFSKYRKIQRILKALHKRRKECDYNLYVNDLKNKSRTAVNEAQELLKIIKVNN